MGVFRQTVALVRKNLLIAVIRHPVATFFRAFFLPVFFMLYLSYSRFLFVVPSVFGVGTPRPIRSLEDGMGHATDGRNTLVLINNGYNGGDIDRVINLVAAPVIAAGKNVTLLPDGTLLAELCRSSLRGATTCYGAVEFASSPSEGPYGRWNYSLRADGSLGSVVNVNVDNNDHQIYALPLQHAIDSAIASINKTVDQSALPETVMEYIFTDIDEEERQKWIRIAFQNTIVNDLGAAFLLGFVGVVYHLGGFMATERDMGMSQLIEAMMPNEERWQPQLARLLSYHISFVLLYIPGWSVMGFVLSYALFTATSPTIIIAYHILVGYAFTSWAYLGASFFRKAQLSGVTIALVTLLLGVVCQAYTDRLDWGVALTVMSALFVPCNYVWFLVYIARFEHKEMGVNLMQSAPENWALQGTWFFVFLGIQTFAYPLIGFFVERYLYGTASEGRVIVKGNITNGVTQNAVELSRFSKHYPPTFVQRLINRKTTPVYAVNGLNLAASQGEVLVLLGANGSGKSTTLDSIAGMNTVTSGTITVNGTGGIGICPQKNVLWDELTVRDHIRIFNKLKSTGAYDSEAQHELLIEGVDLDRKIDAKSHTLSGGQKRKLQLGMMLTGGSAVCCVDEVSSGVDPLSRRKIWDILLAQRGTRTIILTTHFLDEADLLADRIAVISKGTLRAEGSSVELKNKLGGGYRVHLHTTTIQKELPVIHGIPTIEQFDLTTYRAATSTQAALVVKTLEEHGIQDYEFSGPTVEDVFLQLSDEIRNETRGHRRFPSSATDKCGLLQKQEPIGEDTQQPLGLLQGTEIGLLKQGWVMYRKRLSLLRRNFLPYVAVFCVPMICAVLVSQFVKNQHTPTCAPVTPPDATYDTIANQWSYKILTGPSSKVPANNISEYAGSLFEGFPQSALVSLYFKNTSLHVADSLPDFNNYINTNFSNVTPGGMWLGDAKTPPTIAYQADLSFYNAIFAQNVLNSKISNITITTQFRTFENPWQPGTGESLQLVTYFVLVCCAVSAFFALYPTLERLRNVRGLEYSNGVRPAPLWFAYLAFDFAVILVPTLMAVVIFAKLSDVWYHVYYLMIVILLYSLSSILLAYIVSLYAQGQLAAFAIAAGFQALFFLLYLVAFLSVVTYMPVSKIDHYILVAHYSMSLLNPMGSLIRAMFIAMNLFSTTCEGPVLSTKPAGMDRFGGPILYLVIQSIAYFVFLLWHESDSTMTFFRIPRPKRVGTDDIEMDDDLGRETEKAAEDSDGLRVVHLTKSFGKYTAVDNLSFSIQRGEVFALLGPNGAGKSTTISMIRGDIKPSKNGGDIFVDDIAISKNRAKARLHLGVCPQFDAIDQLTVEEHLRFYARVRGVPDIDFNVKAITKAVGLEAFSDRMAPALSGGNKRKLSLGIALMGNPSVLVLDEPSSGMDAAAKRTMWKTLAGVTAGRAILLTTHSMEEADALAHRAGIMAKRMLSLGTTDHLRQKHGAAYHVHLVAKSAPHTSVKEMAGLSDWVLWQFPAAQIEDKAYHGQLRFAIPTAALTAAAMRSRRRGGVPRGRGAPEPLELARAGGVGALVMLLEESKTWLGLEHYSVSPTTLDQVFLEVIEKNNIEEENYEAERPKSPSRFHFGIGGKGSDREKRGMTQL